MRDDPWIAFASGRCSESARPGAWALCGLPDTSNREKPMDQRLALIMAPGRTVAQAI
jgi:hypothetical protein